MKTWLCCHGLPKGLSLFQLTVWSVVHYYQLRENWVGVCGVCFDGTRFGRVRPSVHSRLCVWVVYSCFCMFSGICGDWVNVMVTSCDSLGAFAFHIHWAFLAFVAFHTYRKLMVLSFPSISLFILCEHYACLWVTVESPIHVVFEWVVYLIFLFFSFLFGVWIYWIQLLWVVLP